MEQKLSNEEIAKVFAMYLGCDFCMLPKHKAGMRIDTIQSIGISKVYGIWGTSEDYYEFSEVKLLLTPLEDISDEHAIEVAKMFYENDEFHTTEAGRKIAKTLNDKNSGLGTFVAINLIKVIDQLREWGYMLPYKGINLFEAGIAIKKPSTP